MDERDQKRQGVASDRLQNTLPSEQKQRQQPTTSKSSTKLTQQCAKWSSNSKFNRFLNNIERSILNQFSHHNSNEPNKNSSYQHLHNNASVADNCNKSKNHRSSLLGQQSTTNGAQTRTKAIIQTSSATANGANKPSHSHGSHQRNETQVPSQNVPLHHASRMDRVTSSNELRAINGASTSQFNSASKNGGKTTLNKYQQQLVSTMQTKNKLFASKNNYAHNRLSIPPPHANDEARNQNHKLLFGCSSTPSSNVATSTQSYNNQPSDPSSTNDQTLKLGNNLHVDRIAMHSALDRTTLCHNSSSPASSAQSLPVTNHGSLTSAQAADRSFHNFNIKDDEESGFFTYQSRRSLLDNSNKSNRSSVDCNKLSSIGASMDDNQMPVSNYTDFNNIKPQLPQVIHQNLYYPSLQRQITNTQQHINQVPIMSGLAHTYSHNRLDIQRTNSNNFSDIKHQPYNTYHQLNSQFDVSANRYYPKPQYDGQIYANAPPKPRRHQYYNPNLAIQQHFMERSRTLQDHQREHSIQINNHQQIYNMSNEEDRIYGHARNFHIGNQVRSQRQLPIIPQLALSKAKSSLDIGDLMRFRQNRLQGDDSMQMTINNPNLNGSTKFINQPVVNCNQYYLPRVNDYQEHSNNIGLMRSKSIGNLLPDHNELNMIQQQCAFNVINNNQSIKRVKPKFHPISSASTNNLNHIGLANNVTLTNSNSEAQNCNPIYHYQHQQQDHNVIIPSGKQHLLHLPSDAPLPPMRHYSQKCNIINNVPIPNQQIGISDCNSGFCTTKVNTNTISNGGEVVRQSQQANVSGNTNAPNGMPGFSRQSLDDKIRHLLIGDDKIATTTSAAKPESQEVTAWTKQQSQVPCQPTRIGRNESSRDDDLRVVGNLNLQSVDFDIRKPTANQAYSSNSAAVIMGNKQQRQYKISEALDDKSNCLKSSISTQVHQPNDNVSTNSQLIVDLTTPRVLAKTQTNLLSLTSQSENLKVHDPNIGSKESCSINQLGLPFAVSNITNSVKVTNAPPSQSIANTSDQNNIDSIIRSAPYYYSDLKSEEQRQALLSIVQQKSLSPPPQLLSRSVDQNTTRLAPKSSAPQINQTRTLADNSNFLQRRNELGGVPIGNLRSRDVFNGCSTNSSVARNIDKLFESPVDPQLNQTKKLNSVQSMLALNNTSIEDKDHGPATYKFTDQNQTESLSISSGYCSDALKRAGSKSKSLENVNQQALQEEISISRPFLEDKIKRYKNPVYENINRSDKLLSAINNSTTCLSTMSSSTRCRRSKTNQQPQQVASGSDSMDSILGSSFDGDDDDSEDPDVLDSDNSTSVDFIKLSPTTADMSGLIEQLKNNHSKLTDEYKSTLDRISRILNGKNSSGKKKISDKLTKKLQSLEHKSKKCESRSKNQLALIQMMEKAIRHSKQEINSQDISLSSPSDNRASNSSGSIDSTNSPPPKQSPLTCLISSPCLSFDYQNLKPKEVKLNTNQKDEAQMTHPPPPPAVEAQNFIRAIVTEATTTTEPQKLVAEICSNSSEQRSVTSENIVSLSTRHQQGKIQDRKELGDYSEQQKVSSTTGTVSQKIHSIESRSKNRSNKNVSKKDTSPVSLSTREKEIPENDCGSESCSFQEAEEDEDFIEFLSTGNNSNIGRSQFDSSQFSASDFNNSSSTASTSASSSNSGSVTIDSSNSPSKVDGTIKNTGILKNGLTVNGDGLRSKIRNNNNNNPILKDFRAGENNLGDSKFINVLGNVIDVDVCSMNNLSQCSPVSNK